MICENCKAVCIDGAEKTMLRVICAKCNNIIHLCEDCSDMPEAFCPNCEYELMAGD